MQAPVRAEIVYLRSTVLDSVAEFLFGSDYRLGTRSCLGAGDTLLIEILSRDLPGLQSSSRMKLIKGDSGTIGIVIIHKGVYENLVQVWQGLLSEFIRRKIEQSNKNFSEKQKCAERNQRKIDKTTRSEQAKRQNGNILL